MKNLIISLYVKFVKTLSDIQVYKFPLFFIYNPHEYLFNGKDYATLQSIIEPGDIVLRMYKHHLIQGIIPGFYSHASIYIGNNTIIHSVGEGVCSIDLFDYCKCDGIALIRPNTSKQVKSSAIDYCKAQLGKKYDFFFNFCDEETYSCTELVYWAYENKINTKPKIYKKLFGLLKKEIIEPDDFIQDKHCDLIWESSSVKRVAMLVDDKC